MMAAGAARAQGYGAGDDISLMCSELLSGCSVDEDAAAQVGRPALLSLLHGMVDMLRHGVMVVSPQGDVQAKRR
jgi:hypothetical protein